MKRYRVWIKDTFVDITAECMEMYSVDKKPVKIRFYDNDENVIAEFYCDNICGWAEVNYAS